MKRLFFIFSLIGLCLAFVSCSKEETELKTITNLSGITWYNTHVLFHETAKGESKGYQDAGKIETGQSFTVNTSLEYFHIFAKDQKGTGLFSDTLHFANGKATVSYTNINK